MEVAKYIEKVKDILDTTFSKEHKKFYIANSLFSLLGYDISDFRVVGMDKETSDGKFDFRITTDNGVIFVNILDDEKVDCTVTGIDSEDNPVVYLYVDGLKFITKSTYYTMCGQYDLVEEPDSIVWLCKDGGDVFRSLYNEAKADDDRLDKLMNMILGDESLDIIMDALGVGNRELFEEKFKCRMTRLLCGTGDELDLTGLSVEELLKNRAEREEIEEVLSENVEVLGEEAPEVNDDVDSGFATEVDDGVDDGVDWETFRTDAEAVRKEEASKEVEDMWESEGENPFEYSPVNVGAAFHSKFKR